MRLGLLFSLPVALVFSTSVGAQSADRDVVAMVERGAAVMKANGKDTLIKKINAKDPQFAQGAKYIALRDAKTGIVLAHPYNPSLIGKDLTEVPDAIGKSYRREIIELGRRQRTGWVDFMYKNPTSGQVEAKKVYVMLVEDVTVEGYQ